jgi:hypothetical protein
MISQDRDYEDILRDALRAAAESVEPAGNGLERIRHRSHSRRSARSMLASAADWLQLYRIRLSVRLESFRWELSERGIGRSPTGAHRAGRTRARKTPGRLGPAAAWLKPAFAVAAVVGVVVVGVISLNRTQEAVFTPTNSVTSPGHQHARAGATGLAGSGRGQSGVSPSLPSAVSKAKGALISPLPDATCTQAPTPSGTPAPSDTATASPTPAPSNTATASPTPAPSNTATASPTADPGSSSTTSAALRAAFASDTGGGAPDITCSTATPNASAAS